MITTLDNAEEEFGARTITVPSISFLPAIARLISHQTDPIGLVAQNPEQTTYKEVKL
jgi:hypothetical protein